MNEKRRKKIREYLINFVNEELNKKKRNNKNEILINSTSLAILAQKNMQCKDFLVKENNFYYQQNIDIGWIVGVNFDVNNSYHHKPLVEFFSNKETNEIKKIDDSEVEEEKIEIVNKDTIIKTNLESVLYIHQKRALASPSGISLFQKKEISERKFIKENNDKNEIEKGKDKDKETNSDENIMLVKHFSNITLETELSRIIRCCHEEDCPSSQEHCISESRRSEINLELKIAKYYAKRLNLYCKQLKNNINKSYLNSKIINTQNKNYETEKKKEKINDDKNINKVKSTKLHKIKKIIIKKHINDRKEKISKFNNKEKKHKINKVLNDSDKNNLIENSFQNKGNITSREDAGKNKKGLVKINQNAKEKFFNF